MKQGERNERRVQHGLGYVRVQVGHRAGEGGDVVGEAVVGVVQPSVKVGHPVGEVYYTMLRLLPEFNN